VNEQVEYGRADGWWVIIATVLGSGIVFLDSTVVNVALPRIGRDLHAGLAGLQWTLDGFLLMLGSLIITAGSLGDLFGRRKMFVLGLWVFGGASLACGLAPNIGALIAARVVQGIGGALLVPQSLAIIGGAFTGKGQARAVAVWSGWSGLSTLFGPALGGWLVDTASWRWIFFINPPLIAVAIYIALRKVPESMDLQSARRLDFPGSLAATAALGGIVYMLIEGPGHGFVRAGVLSAGIAGAVMLVVFFVWERTTKNPMIPGTLFKSRQFTGANLTTAMVYFSLYGISFLLTLQLQNRLGYSALLAGFATTPITVLLLFLSPVAGRVSTRFGPRLPMTVGPIVIAIGLVFIANIRPGDSYLAGVLPGVFIFGLGLSFVVAPLTAAMLASVAQRHVGVGSAVNNMIARVGGLLAIALLPVLAGVRSGATPSNAQYGRAMLIAAGFCLVGGLVAFATIRRAAPPEKVAAVA
jgi:EmrB/QacA subfamily drug resistance transporter